MDEERKKIPRRLMVTLLFKCFDLLKEANVLLEEKPILLENHNWIITNFELAIWRLDWTFVKRVWSNRWCNFLKWSSFVGFVSKTTIAWRHIVNTARCFSLRIILFVILATNLTLKLPHQSNWLVLQFYFKIPTSCYIFPPQWCNDFRNNNQRNNIMNFIFFFMYSN